MSVFFYKKKTAYESRISDWSSDVCSSDLVAIMNAIADHPATVNVVVDGLAASAASYIAMAGDSLRMNRGSQMMIHDAAGLCWGNAADMESMKALQNGRASCRRRVGKYV